MNEIPIPFSPIYHAELDPKSDRLERHAAAYLRFGREVEITYLRLPLNLDAGRWTPVVPSHPAHLRISSYGEASGSWVEFQEVSLPVIHGLAGEEFTEKTTVDEAQAYLERVAKTVIHRIEFDEPVRCRALKVICDREHPVWENHGECNGGVYNVPFSTLKPLEVYGTFETDTLFPVARRLPLLSLRGFAPQAPENMVEEDLPDKILFSSSTFSIGFSLRRPMLMHLGWDAYGRRASENRLCLKRNKSGKVGGLSGPLLRLPDLDYPSHLWGGTVTVDKNRVIYEAACGEDSFGLRVTFTVHPDGFEMSIDPGGKSTAVPIEFESWRFAWDMEKGMTSTAALPSLHKGRNGRLSFPLSFASDGRGVLRCEVTEGTPSIQTESHHDWLIRTDGVITNGTQRVGLSFSVDSYEPESGTTAVLDESPGLSRYWGSIYSCFRPELWGFSNHAVSTNCHVNQYAPIEIAVHTRRGPGLADPLAMARFTIGSALRGGGGYGYFRQLYLDSDPVLLSMAGKLHQAEADSLWFSSIIDGVVLAYQRIVSHIDESGLSVSSRLSGNSGSHRWSSNAMDVIGFGHKDAYVNAWCYRALMNVKALFEALGRKELAQEAAGYAASLKAAYAACFLNPETGWVAGWRSADGKLHDYGFIWVNGPAIAFGLLDEGQAVKALKGLEELRESVGLCDARLGLPCNLLPIDPADQMGVFTPMGNPSFEIYTDGGLSGSGGYYLRALSRYGLTEEAGRLADELDEGYDHGIFCGPAGGGQEFLTWEGLPTGYEGTLIVRLLPLYAIAVEKGRIEPFEPEWWP